MVATKTSDRVWFTLYRMAGHRDARQKAGWRFVTIPSLTLDDHPVYCTDPEALWYRPLPEGVLAGSAEESDRWAEAARSYQETLSGALQELRRAHRGGFAEALLTPWYMLRLPGDPLQWRGWRRRRARRSERAQRAFLARVEPAREAYRPVREEIERRREEADAALRKSEEARRREEERRRRVLEHVASRRSWVCVAGADDILVYRVDLPPDPEPDAAQFRSEPLSARELETVLQQQPQPGEEPGRRKIRWDPRGCAAVEKECREQDVDVTFAAWWDWVTQGRWRTAVTTSGGHTVHVSSHHSSHGVGGSGDGGSGGYSGSHGTSF